MNAAPSFSTVTSCGTLLMSGTPWLKSGSVQISVKLMLKTFKSLLRSTPRSARESKVLSTPTLFNKSSSIWSNSSKLPCQLWWHSETPICKNITGLTSENSSAKILIFMLKVSLFRVLLIWMSLSTWNKSFLSQLKPLVKPSLEPSFKTWLRSGKVSSSLPRTTKKRTTSSFLLILIPSTRTWMKVSPPSTWSWVTVSSRWWDPKPRRLRKSSTFWMRLSSSGSKCSVNGATWKTFSVVVLSNSTCLKSPSFSIKLTRSSWPLT